MKDRMLENKRVFTLVENENTSQLAKWGIQDRDSFEWMCFLTEEVGELAASISEWTYRDGPTGNVVKEAIQVATLALKIAEMFYEEQEAIDRVIGAKNWTR